MTEYKGVKFKRLDEFKFRIIWPSKATSTVIARDEAQVKKIIDDIRRKAKEGNA